MKNKKRSIVKNGIYKFLTLLPTHHLTPIITELFLGTRVTLQLYAAATAVVLGISYAINRFLRYEGVKYSQNGFDDEEFGGALGKTASYLSTAQERNPLLSLMLGKNTPQCPS